MSNLLNFIAGLIKGIKEFFVPFLVFSATKNKIEKDALKKAYEKEVRFNEIETNNARKSDDTILNELRERDTRDEP